MRSFTNRFAPDRRDVLLALALAIVVVVAVDAGPTSQAAMHAPGRSSGAISVGRGDKDVARQHRRSVVDEPSDDDRFYMALAAAGLGDSGDDRHSETESASESETPSVTITPPPTRTRTDTSTRTATQSESTSESSTLEPSPSVSSSLVPGACSHILSVSPLEPVVIPFTDVTGAPENLFDRTLTYYETEAVAFRETGVDISVIVRDAIIAYGPAVDLNDLFRVIVKDRLFFKAIESSELYFDGSDPALSDFPSSESHGLQRYLDEDKLTIETSSTLRRYSVRLLPVQTYRLALPEWIFLAIRRNVTIPSGCGVERPIAIHVKAFEPSGIVVAAQYMCAVAMVVGIVAAASGASVPSSHQAGMVALIAYSHFAQEDGRPLTVALHPFQFPLGTDKYRYVRASMISCIIICGTVLLIQSVALKYLMKRRGMLRIEAQQRVLFPRVLAAFTQHLAPTLLFAAARSFGNLTTSSYLYTSISLLLFTGFLFITHRVTLSQSIPFCAEFVPAQQPAVHPLLKGIHIDSHLQNTTLRSHFPNVLHEVKGYWRSTDADGLFVSVFGYVFENFRPSSRMWLVWEFIDTFLTCVLAVFDNYSPFLAFYQFFLTLCVKLAVILAIIVKKPLISSHSMLLYLILYSCQSIALLALSIGALRLPLLPMSVAIHDVACLAAALVILVDVGVVIARSLLRFYVTFTRKRGSVATDATRREAIELDETLIVPKGAAVVDEHAQMVAELRRRALADADNDDDADDEVALMQSAPPEVRLAVEQKVQRRQREANVPLGSLVNRQEVDVDAAAAEADAVKIAEQERAAAIAEAMRQAELEDQDDGLTAAERESMRRLEDIPLKQLEEGDDDVYDSDGMEVDRYHPKWKQRLEKQAWRAEAKKQLALLSKRRAAHAERTKQKAQEALQEAEAKVVTARLRAEEAEMRKVRQVARQTRIAERIKAAKAAGLDITQSLLRAEQGADSDTSSADDGGSSSFDDDEYDDVGALSSDGDEMPLYTTFNRSPKQLPASPSARRSIAGLHRMDEARLAAVVDAQSAVGGGGARPPVRHVVAPEELAQWQLRGPAARMVAELDERRRVQEQIAASYVGLVGSPSAAGANSTEQHLPPDVEAPPPAHRGGQAKASNSAEDLARQRRVADEQERYERNHARRRAQHWAELEAASAGARPPRRLTEEDYTVL